MEQNSAKSGTSKHTFNTTVSTNASATLAALVSTPIKASENSTTCDKSKTNKTEHSTLACSSVNTGNDSDTGGFHSEMEGTRRNGNRKKCNREAVVQSSVTNSTATQTISCASSSHTCTYPVVTNNITSTTVISGATSTTTTTCKKSHTAISGVPGSSNLSNHLLTNCTDNNGSDASSVKSQKTMKSTPILRLGGSATVARTKRTSPSSPPFPSSVVVGGGGGHSTHSTPIFGPADISTSDDDEISEVRIK